MNSDMATSTITTLSCLELLPPEIQAKILRSLIGFKSLSAVIHASPRLHQVYLTTIDRQELWTKVTLNELSDRGLGLFPPAPVVQVCGLTSRRKLQSEFVHPALMTLYGRVKHKKTITLNHRDRQALCQIGNMVKWDVIEASDGKLEVVQLNYPHGKQNGLSRGWHWSNDEASSGLYQIYVIGRYYGQRKAIEALVKQKHPLQREAEWRRDRNEFRAPGNLAQAAAEFIGCWPQ